MSLQPKTDQLPPSCSLNIVFTNQPTTLAHLLSFTSNPISHGRRCMPSLQHPERSLDDIQPIPASPHLCTDIFHARRAENLMQEGVTPQPEANRAWAQDNLCR